MKRLYVVVVGCGRLGAHLAELLSRAGHEVVVVDRDEAALAGLPADSYSGFRIEGDACEPAVLRRARIERADLVIAATREDNVNFMVSVLARRMFHVPHVFARVYDPRRQKLYGPFGVETVCPTTIGGEAFFKSLYRVLEETGGTP